jgi:dTDP-4-dehydrorhamnose 3,5-epimerase
LSERVACERAEPSADTEETRPMALAVHETEIEGLWVVDLVVHHDPDRPGATFREAYQAAKLRALGLPEFQPVQFNVSESPLGTLRGFHAEPWEKFIHVVSGRAFSAIADIRPDSPTYKKVWTGELASHNAIFVTRGLANSFQAVTELVTYTYLTSEHWQPGLAYRAVAWDDPELAVAWPITDARLKLSAKDVANPTLAELHP